MTRNERRNSILMTCHYPDLNSVSQWLVVLWGKFVSTNQKNYPYLQGQWHVISMDFLSSFLRHHFAGKPVESSRNLGCFLKLHTCKLMNISQFAYYWQWNSCTDWLSQFGSVDYFHSSYVKLFFVGSGKVSPDRVFPFLFTTIPRTS